MSAAREPLEMEFDGITVRVLTGGMLQLAFRKNGIDVYNLEPKAVPPGQCMVLSDLTISAKFVEAA